MNFSIQTLKRYSIGICCICTILMEVSCIDEKPKTEDLILGTWTLNHATRNERATNSLDGLYFDFITSDSLISNLMGDTTTYRTSMGESSLKIEKSWISDFQISEINDSTLYMSTSINNDVFRLVLKR